jgi:hypothetical protein
MAPGAGNETATVYRILCASIQCTLYWAQMYRGNIGGGATSLGFAVKEYHGYFIMILIYIGTVPVTAVLLLLQNNKRFHISGCGQIPNVTDRYSCWSNNLRNVTFWSQLRAYLQTINGANWTNISGEMPHPNRFVLTRSIPQMYASVMTSVFA